MSYPFQFFIGDLAGTDIKNGIARALLDRLVLAAQREEHFKAIVVVPMHPEGDYISSSGPRGVMNYQYKTICRGAKSLIEQFKTATRGSKDPMNFICFMSLRNWGQLDGKLMFDQIYVHDKVIETMTSCNCNIWDIIDSTCYIAAAHCR